MTESSRTSARGELGFTIIEVLVAATILLVGILGTVTLIDAAALTTQTTKAREQAVDLQREVVEAARTIPYSQLDNSTIVSKVQAMPNLGNASAGPGWTVQRRGVTYNVSLGTCAVDDPTDGYGTEDPNKFCATRAAPNPPCSTLLSGATSIAGNSTVLAGLTGSLSGQLAVGACGLDLALNGHVSNLVQSDIGLCALGVCAPTVGTDTQPDDYRRIVSLVTWKLGQNVYSVQQATTVVNPGGQAYGPSISALTTVVPSPIISSYAGAAVPFVATTTSDATNVIWSVDGTDQGVATVGLSNAWSFSWTIGASGTGTEVLDGSYVVSARAINAYGVNGATRALTVTLNRRRPYPPASVAGGRNGSVAEFEWAANKERDIAGYRVYRSPAGGPDVKVCDVATTITSCQDGSPPSGSPLSYYVVALDRDTVGNLREGDHSATVTVTNTNQAPNAPSNLLASPSGANTVLAWAAATVSDPDGDPVAFYRIYRDGQLYANRYDRTAGAQTTYTDTKTGGIQHTYSVTAVDASLAESTLLGPVTQ
jgi:type II secretory pathway pseudopilin PulG